MTTMKKIFALSLLLISVLIAKADERPVVFDQLPAAAQTFIKTHFADAKMVYATMDSDFTETDYEVRLDNGAKIEFNGSGNWKEVQNKSLQVPSSVVPEGIAEYVKQYFPDARIVKLERKTFRYDVSLSNHIELEFDLNSKFLRYDD